MTIKDWWTAATNALVPGLAFARHAQRVANANIEHARLDFGSIRA